MTDKANDAAPVDAQPAADDAASLTANKNFWAGVGIGSAALVAALIYAKRPKKK
jgi:hypothetical protein